MWILAGVFAVAARAELKLGDPREAVVAELGAPSGSSQIGTKEVLFYPQGRVVLRDGRLEEISEELQAGRAARAATESAGPTQPAKTPPPAPSPPAAAPAPKVDPRKWMVNYEAARARARAEGKPVLALFTGTDWCPPCVEFEEQVAHSGTFLDYAAPRVVLLKLDFPRRSPQPPELRAQNEALRSRIMDGGYPSFYLLNADGSVRTRLRTTGPRAVANMQEYFVQALEEGLGGGGERTSSGRVRFGVAALIALGVWLLGRHWSRQAGRR